MAAVVDDMLALVVTAPPIVPSTSVFRSERDTVSTGPGPYVVFIATGGTGPVYTHNQKSPEIRRPGVQITVVADSAKVADATAQQIYDRVVSVRNETINGTYYLRIVPLNEPFGRGLDERGRQRITFNVLISKR